MLLLRQGESFFPSSLLHESPAGLRVLAAMICISAVLVDGVLAARQTSLLAGSRPRLLLRFMVAAVPILGLALFPLAARRLRPHSVNATPPRSLMSRAIVRGAVARPLSLLRSASSSLVLLSGWLALFQIIPYLALLSWLASSSIGSDAAWWAAVTTSIGFHLLVFVGTRAHVAALSRHQTGGWMGLLLRLGPFLLLVPGPPALAGAFGLVALGTGEPRRDNPGAPIVLPPGALHLHPPQPPQP